MGNQFAADSEGLVSNVMESFDLRKRDGTLVLGGGCCMHVDAFGGHWFECNLVHLRETGHSSQVLLLLLL
jgi:hypothetical protein